MSDEEWPEWPVTGGSGAQADPIWSYPTGSAGAAEPQDPWAPAYVAAPGGGASPSGASPSGANGAMSGERWTGRLALAMEVVSVVLVGTLMYWTLRGLYPITSSVGSHLGVLAAVLGFTLVLCLAGVALAIVSLFHKGSRVLAVVAVAVVILGVPLSLSIGIGAGVRYLSHALMVTQGSQIGDALQAQGVSIPGWVSALLHILG